MRGTMTSSTNLEEEATRRLRWGIVGCGAVCEVKSDPAFYKCNNSSLVAVMRRDGAKAEDFATRHGVEKFYSSAADLINDEEVDAVYVATPPGGDRAEIARMVARAEKPCYMEKPLGRDGKEAKEIASIFQQAGVPLYVAYYRRCMPKFVAAKRALDENRIGSITGVSVTLHQSRHMQKDKTHWHYNKTMSGGGLFMDVGCHMLDLVDYMVGPIMKASGISFLSVNDQTVEDNVRGFWQHTCAVPSRNATCTTTPDDGRRQELNAVGGSCVFNFSSGGPRRDEIEIVGTAGSLIFSCFDTKPAELRLADAAYGSSSNADGSDGSVLVLDAQHPETVQQPMIQLVTQDIILHLSKKDGEERVCDTAKDTFETPSLIDPKICLCSGEAAVRTSVAMDNLLGRERWNDDYINL
mmetsp:Transcript_34784/g.75429  ORF Transcript_34784/g.75429 Transcript_34784/m.75429 type:complete len:410 (+) Transcript_34784:176-1405(+)